MLARVPAFFCAQGIALRGHRETNLEYLSVNVGNFRSLMILQSGHDNVKQRLSEGRNASWLSREIQNELLSSMAQWVSSKLTAEANYFTKIADEMSMSNFLFAYAVYKGIIHEFFLGLCVQKSSMHQLLLSIF